MKVAGIILAGGAGQRMGGGKPLALLTGRPLAAYVLDAMLGATIAAPDVVMSGPEHWAQPLALAAIADDDRLPNGPLNGVLAGLTWARLRGASHAMVIACDMPFVTSDDVLGFIQSPISAPIIVGQSSSGIEPLFSLWDIAATIQPLAEILASGTHPPIFRWMGDMGARAINLSDSAARNINEAAQLAQLNEPPNI